MSQDKEAWSIFRLWAQKEKSTGFESFICPVVVEDYGFL